MVYMIHQSLTRRMSDIMNGDSHHQFSALESTARYQNGVRKKGGNVSYRCEGTKPKKGTLLLEMPEKDWTQSLITAPLYRILAFLYIAKLRLDLMSR